MASRTDATNETLLMHLLDLDNYGLSDVTDPAKITKAKRDVSSFVKNEMLRSMSDGISPVKGEGRFPILDPDYAKEHKAGRRRSDLELEGDLKDSLIVEPSSGSFIRAGHQGAQVPKAHGHNQIIEKAKNWAKEIKFPKRRYIPDDKQVFIDKITNGIREIIEPLKDRPIDDTEELDDDIFAVSSLRETEDLIEVGGANIFDDDVIESLLAQAFNDL